MQPPRISKINERHKSTDCRSSENPELENPAQCHVVIFTVRDSPPGNMSGLSRELCPTTHILDSLCKKILALANLCPSDMWDQGKLVRNTYFDPFNSKHFKATVEKKICMYDLHQRKHIYHLHLQGTFQ